MPYCPECHQGQVEGGATCPLDGRTYRVWRCSACGLEVAPDEAWCIGCGVPLGSRGEGEVVGLPHAAWGSRTLAVVVDLLCLSYLESAVPAAVETLLARIVGSQGEVRMVLSVVLPVLYFSLLTWNGHRTVGQQIMGIAVLTRERRPLPFVRSFLRAVLLSVVLAGVGVGALAWLAQGWPEAVVAISSTPWGGWIRLALAPGALPLQVLLVAASLLLACSLLLPGRTSLHDRVAESDVFAVEGQARVEARPGGAGPEPGASNSPA